MLQLVKRKEAGVTLINVRTKSISREKEGNFLMIGELINQEDMTRVNTDTPNHRL